VQSKTGKLKLIKKSDLNQPFPF